MLEQNAAFMCRDVIRQIYKTCEIVKEGLTYIHNSLKSVLQICIGLFYRSTGLSYRYV